jgi:hypothetical protein
MIRAVSSNELFTVLIVASLVIITMAKLVSPKRFYDFVFVFGRTKYLKIYAREQKFFDRFDALLFTNLIVSAGIFVFILYQYLIDATVISINFMFKLTFGIGAFFLIKVLVERLVGSLFEIDKLIDEYLFQKITYKNYLGLLLLPINALLIFTLSPTLVLFYIIGTLLITVNIIGLITSFKTHQSLIKNNLFYFILYLCALEIAPYIILYKVFISN